MLLRPSLLLALFTAFAASAQAQQPATAQHDSVYAVLLTRLKARDTTIDFTALRFSLAGSSQYEPYGSDADVHRDSMSAALERRDFPNVIIQADSALAIDYLDVRTHVLRAYAAANLGDTSSATWDRVVAALLVRSIARSGTGTVDSPYVVISVAEEYALLNMTGYERGQQALGQCGAKPCDILETRHRKTGEGRKFYFDITLPQAFLDRTFKSN